MLKGYVLLVDDDRDLRESMADAIRDEGFEVVTAANGQEAFECLRQRPSPCLILLDLMMPVMDGWEFQRRKQADPSLSAIPVCIVSAVAANAPTGVQLTLSKPPSLDRLLDTVVQHCVC